MDFDDYRQYINDRTDGRYDVIPIRKEVTARNQKQYIRSHVAGIDYQY